MRLTDGSMIARILADRRSAVSPLCPRQADLTPGYVLAKLRRVDEVRDVLGTLEGVSGERYVPAYAMALVQAGLGKREAVFEWLNRAYDARDVHLIFLPVDPKWDRFRSDRRFKTLVSRCGFSYTSEPAR